MPIEVQHGNGSSAALNAAVAYLLAQNEAAKQQQQQQPQDLLGQLAPILTRRQTPQVGGLVPMLPGEDGGGPSVGSGAASYTPRAVRAPRYYDNSGGGRMSRPYTDPLLLQQLRGDQQAALLNDRQEQQREEQAQREAEMLNRQQTADVPDWIGKGIADGSLRYTPSQKQEEQKQQNIKERALQDKSLRPDERAWVIANANSRIRDIRMNPEQVPLDERPKTLRQQAQEGMWTDTDKGTGLDITWQVQSRNGQLLQVPLATSETLLKNWLAEQDHKRAMELAQVTAGNKETPDQTRQATLRIEEDKAAKARVDKAEKDYWDAVDEWKAQLAGNKDYKERTGTEDQAGESKLAALLARYRSLGIRWEDEQKRYAKYQQQRAAEGSQPMDMGGMPPQGDISEMQYGPTPLPPPQQMGMGSPMPQAPGLGQQPIRINTPSDVDALRAQLQPGQVVRIILPDGRMGDITKQPQQAPPQQAPPQQFRHETNYEGRGAWMGLPDWPKSGVKHGQHFNEWTKPGESYYDQRQNLVVDVVAADPWEHPGGMATEYVYPVANMEEAASLPPGTRYILPDGVRGTT